MNRALAALTLAVLFATAAEAQWTVDRPAAYASLPAKAPDRGVSATLEISCVAGERLTSVRLSAPMTRGRIAANLRADEGEARPLANLRVLSDPHRIPILTAPRYSLAGKKRFRVELFPTGSPALSYDFDLAGIDQAIAGVACRP